MYIKVEVLGYKNIMHHIHIRSTDQFKQVGCTKKSHK